MADQHFCVACGTDHKPVSIFDEPKMSVEEKITKVINSGCDLRIFACDNRDEKRFAVQIEKSRIELKAIGVDTDLGVALDKAFVDCLEDKDDDND